MATTDKYDRQLRLWGANGQRSLMTSHILLIHANGVGAETLKNLVLPGIGKFTILDDFIVNPNDLSSNFFVTIDSIGKPRAEVVRDLLCEMNPDVKGNARVANFRNILQTEPHFFEHFNLIITANLPENHVLPLAHLCEQKRINLVLLRSYGLIGSIRLQLPKHSVVESKKEQAQFDLRICDPFPELLDLFENFPSFSLLNSLDHAHIPFVVILFRALQTWKLQNNQKFPETFDEKRAFQESIRQLSRNFNNEVNFQEAVKEYYYAYKRATPSPELLSLLQGQHNQVLDAQSENFDLLLRGLEIFLDQNDNLVPLSGLLPDMTATTDTYVQLQSILHQKASKDRESFKQIVVQLLQGLERGTVEKVISDEEIEIFCKNCQTVTRIQTKSFSDEVSESDTSEVLNDILRNDLFEDPIQSPILWYIALRAVDCFYQKYARWPGSNNDSVGHDQQEVFQEIRQLAETLSIPSYLIGPNEISDNSAMETESGSDYLLTMAHAVEMTRFGGHELHNICSIIGGIAAQEVVKIITHQYIPLNNTYIFNGIASCGAVYSL